MRTAPPVTIASARGVGRPCSKAGTVSADAAAVNASNVAIAKEGMRGIVVPRRIQIETVLCSI